MMQEKTDLKLVCGSFFIMSDARDYFGYAMGEADDNYS